MIHIMCPGDTDWCPHHGCTTCQGSVFYFPDPDNGAGRIEDNNEIAWSIFMAKWILRYGDN